MVEKKPAMVETGASSTERLRPGLMSAWVKSDGSSQGRCTKLASILLLVRSLGPHHYRTHALQLKTCTNCIRYLITLWASGAPSEELQGPCIPGGSWD